MSRFIVYRPTKEDIAEAKRRTEKLGVLKSSFTRGKGRMTGFLGEIAFERIFTEAIYVGGDLFTHDYEIHGQRVDVKAMSCSVTPKPYFTAAVLKNRKARLPADVYFFTWVHKDLKTVWLGGWSTSKSVMRPKFYKKMGESDGYGFTYTINGYRIPIRATRRPDSFERQYRKPLRG